ncbi:MAG: SUMF1/EgtB/PvdO family nonheme iron enzyme [Anaerolineae bacterium]|nr:SUMF1/EgtB/PvdO family nonheme iron enzyme [Anaerolineae bacterium]
MEIRLRVEPTLSEPPTIEPMGASWSDTHTKNLSLGIGPFTGTEEWSRSAFEVLPEIVAGGITEYPFQLDLAALRIPADAEAIRLHFAVALPESYRRQPFTVRAEPVMSQGGKPSLTWQAAEFNHQPASEVPPEIEPIGDDISVFISYERESESTATAIREQLQRAGFTVWQDVENIRHTDLWLMAIDQALRETDRLVLLMTPKAMESQGVFVEWFFYYNKRKPIHCLMVETCEPNVALLPYQYLDWRDSAKRDWARLVTELHTPPKPAWQDIVINSPHAPARTLPEALQALLVAVRSDTGTVALTDEQARQVAEHHPADLTEYRLGRIAEWSLPRYQLDNRFVQLSLLVDQGEEAQGPRWQEKRRFDDLRELLAETPDAALVLLGAPGSGKSTLLRRLELDLAVDRLRDDGNHLTFFIQLNQYRAPAPGSPLPAPGEWLAQRWQARYPDLPPLPDLLREGRMLLLLDALNEMPHRDSREYRERIDLWKHFLLETLRDCPGNRVLFSCRSLDYSAPLSSPDLRVPQVQIEPMDDARIQQFLAAYLPAQADAIWAELDRSPQLDLFRTPYFLKLLLDQVEAHQAIPEGRAGLFTGFVRQSLRREIERGGRLFQPDTLLTDYDWERLTTNQWRDEHDLPEDGALLPRISRLAFQMQTDRIQTEGAQVRIKRDQARTLLDHDRSADILRAGTELSVLDEDRAQQEVMFFHQLLQEFFAARKLARDPQPELVRVAWHVDHVAPTLAETLERIADSDPLPPLPATGWEETTVIAAAMSADPDAFVRNLMEANLPLAARCAAAPDVRMSNALCDDIRQALLDRTQDPQADLRARIAAGLALGEVGDPRFERRTGPHGDYLLPPLIPLEGGEYPIGSDEGLYDDEAPAHMVTLESFQIGQFPVTNAEYKLFMDAGGYEDEQWWATDAAHAWLRGEGSTEGSKQEWREIKKTLESQSEDHIRSLVMQNRITSQQADDWIIIRSWTEERFEEWLDETFPSGEIYRQPRFWDDSSFNNPAQPVVGVTWFEARAYCNWLTANALTPGPSPTRGEGNWERWEITPELAAKMTEIARRLRRESMPSEDILWQALRNRQLDGRKFRRQEAVGPFVLDFFCPQERLAVEIDGAVHGLLERKIADAERQTLIESLGIRFVRLSADLVEQNLSIALDHIRAAFLPSPRVGEGPGVRVFRLPTEAQFEAAARSKAGRQYPYGSEFEANRGNTFESHIRRTTPVGIFDNATPEGAFDLSGNVYTWTTSIYDQEQFPYPYRTDDGREDPAQLDARRVVRGGSWLNDLNFACCAYRDNIDPNYRFDNFGFRVVCASPI